MNSQIKNLSCTRVWLSTNLEYLSFRSTWKLKVWLFLDTTPSTPCSVSFWCTLGGSVEVWMKNIPIFYSVRCLGQTHSSMPTSNTWCDEFGPQWTEIYRTSLFSTIYTVICRHTPQTTWRETTYIAQFKTTNGISQGDHLPTKSPIDLRDINSTMITCLALVEEGVFRGSSSYYFVATNHQQEKTCKSCLLQLVDLTSSEDF